MTNKNKESFQIDEDFKIVSFYFKNNLGHPYEDSYQIGELIKINEKRYLPLIVCDGATQLRKEDGSYEKPSHAKTIANLICQKTMIFLKNKLLEENSLDLEKICYQSLDFANFVAFNYNQIHNLKEEKLAGSTLTLAVLELLRGGKKTFFWASIGDSPLLLFKTSKTILINPNQLRNYQLKKEALKKLFGRNIKDFRLWLIRNLRNKHYQFDGIDVGYGLLTGETGAKDYFIVGKNQIEKGDFLLLATDGFIAAGLEILTSVINDHGIIFEKKLSITAQKILAALQKEEKRNDDITGILIQML